MLVLLLIFDLLSCSAADTFSLVVPVGSVSGHVGSSVVLPCSLSPALNAKNDEIRWFGPKDKENPILLYKDLKVQENSVDPQYRGRVSLIGELEKGNVSLKLEDITVTDRGEYECYVKSAQWYEYAKLGLITKVVGSSPVLSSVEAGEQVNVTCESGGWSPQPNITWRDKRGREHKNSGDQYITDSEGLVSVRSWLLFSPLESEWISCSVGLSDQEMKEGRVLPLKINSGAAGKTENEPELETGVSNGWKIVTIILIIILLAFTALTIFIFIKRREKKSKKARTDEELKEMKVLLPENEKDRHDKINESERMKEEMMKMKSLLQDKETDLENMRRSEHEREIHLNNKISELENSKSELEKSNRELEIRLKDKDQEVEKIKKDYEERVKDLQTDWKKMLERKVAIKPGPTDPLYKCILFKERIHSGQYYWEVAGMKVLNDAIKSWYTGVTSEKEMSKDVPLTPQNGYWVLQWEKDKGHYVSDPSFTPVLVREGFSKLGVFIDCEKHTLSFYDCVKQSHLYTFYHVDCTKPLTPVLYPESKHIRICDKKCIKCDELYLPQETST